MYKLKPWHRKNVKPSKSIEWFNTQITQTLYPIYMVHLPTFVEFYGFMVNVGKYTIPGAHGYELFTFIVWKLQLKSTLWNRWRTKAKDVPWVWPPPSNSHHQDYYIGKWRLERIEDPSLPGNSVMVTFLGWWVYVTPSKVLGDLQLGDKVCSRIESPGKLWVHIVTYNIKVSFIA